MNSQLVGLRSLEHKEEKADLAVHCAAASLPAEIHELLSSKAGMVSGRSFCTSGPLVKAGVLINFETFLYFSAHYEQYNPFRAICEQLYKC